MEKEATDRKNVEEKKNISMHFILLFYCKVSCQTLLQSSILLGEKLVL